MEYVKRLIDKDGNVLYPQTIASEVYLTSGQTIVSIETALNQMPKVEATYGETPPSGQKEGDFWFQITT